jgi:hypothetical protein
MCSESVCSKRKCGSTLATLEKDVLERVREIRARRQEETDSTDGEQKITGIEISVGEDES